MATVNNVSFTDFGAEQEEIARRRKMAEMMQQDAQTPLESQSAGGWVTPTSHVSGLAKLLKAYVAGKGIDEAGTKQKALAARMRSEASDWATDMPQAQTRDLNLVSGDDEGNVAPTAMQTTQPTKQQMMAWALKGGLSGNPMASAMAGPMMSNLLKQEEPYSLREGERRFGPNGQSIAENPKAPLPLHFGNTGTAIQGFDQRTGAPQGPATPVLPAPVRNDPNKPFMPDGTPNPAYQQYEKDKAMAGSTRVQTNVNAFTPASEEAQRDFIKSTRTTYDQLKQAPVALESIERAKALIPQARGFMGPGGETLLDAAKFLNNRVGMNINTEGVKNAEELRTRIFFNIMDNLKKMDAQPSKEQQTIMQESLGKLGTDPNALPAVLDAFADVMRGKVDLHNQEVQGAIQRGVKFPYDPIVKLGGSGTPARRSTDGQARTFSSEAEANAAGLSPGTKVIINGVSGTWQ